MPSSLESLTGVIPGALSDAELVAQCRRGEDAAWRELVQRFSRYVYAIATRAYGLRDRDAEDVFQDVFARTYEHLDSLRKDEAIRPWIAQLTRRLSVDRLRRADREQPREESELDRADPEDAIAEIDEALSVREALTQLPEPCQDLLDRFFARDQSYRTLGEVLGLPAGTIASRISRCLAKLGDELRKIGHPRFVTLTE
jgi:RNA polymerase sigma-70 factor (ECF subfamily)